MTDVEIGIAAFGRIVQAVLRSIRRSVTGRGIDGMSIGVSRQKVQSMRVAFGESDLQRVVNRVAQIAELIEKTHVRKARSA